MALTVIEFHEWLLIKKPPIVHIEVHYRGYGAYRGDSPAYDLKVVVFPIDVRLSTLEQLSPEQWAAYNKEERADRTFEFGNTEPERQHQWQHILWEEFTQLLGGDDKRLEAATIVGQINRCVVKCHRLHNRVATAAPLRQSS